MKLPEENLNHPELGEEGGIFESDWNVEQVTNCTYEGIISRVETKAHFANVARVLTKRNSGSISGCCSHTLCV